jgi:hypothetical protein
VVEPVTPYRVAYSERVRRRLTALAGEAAQRGDGEQFAAALKEFHRRLCIYPQFGDPLFNLKEETGQVYNGILRPLAMRYGVYEDRRLVVVVNLPVLLPMRVPEP